MKNVKNLIAISLLLFALPFVFSTVSQAQTIKVADRLAQCEDLSRQLKARNSELESKVAELEERLGTGDVKVITKTIEGGYEDISFVAVLNGTSQLRVMVNGQTVGTYDQNARVYLGEMGVLRRGAVNKITFAFSGDIKGNYMYMSVLPKGGNSGSWQQVFNFKPTSGKLEDSFEVPFAGKVLAEDKDSQKARSARPLPASLNHNETLVIDVD